MNIKPSEFTGTLLLPSRIAILTFHHRDQLSQWSQLYKFYNLQSVDNASFQLIYTKFRLMNSIIETGPKERWQHFSYWKNILASIHQRPLTERIESEALVEINFMYSGTSSLECWRWLKMVKNRLNELRTCKFEPHHSIPQHTIFNILY